MLLAITINESAEDAVWVELVGTYNDLLSYGQWLKSKGGAKCCRFVGNSLYALLGALLDVGGIVTVDDEETKRIWTTDNDKMLGVLRDAGVLRDYQCELVRAGVCAPLGRGVLKAPPGAGKTRVCAAICVFAANNGYICWHYVVKSSELVQQALHGMRTAIDEMLLILDANQLPYIRPEISGSTYANIKVHGDEFDGLLIDECHHLPTRTRAIPYAACRARYRIGLSATPTDRSDEDGNALVKGLLGPVLISIPRERIVNAGHLAGSIVKQVPIGA